MECGKTYISLYIFYMDNFPQITDPILSFKLYVVP